MHATQPEGRCAVLNRWLAAFLLCGTVATAVTAIAEDTRPQPQSPDARIVVELFAEHPQIVTPTGLAVDRHGRVFVAESHTHFRPDDYDGPPHDRILVFEDTDGDGRADRRTVFHEGFTHLMQLAFAPDGALYASTRMDIHRLEDRNGDLRADNVTPIVRMQTTGTYPHNGLSGLAFDFAGRLHFGLGENLGHAYTLTGTDGRSFSGGGEGGTTYRVNADGTGLIRTSTGWWNPWGMCVDAFGRVFGTDNDPGASPPCRLIQVVPGGDYGYEYRYGRSGLHPLVTWTGEFPGTLPMVSGTSEAPCAIVAYESDGLPDEYRGHLLVACWADHRIEHFAIRQPADRGLVAARRGILVQADGDFRPVGLDVAPDGSVYVSDWVLSNYQLHKHGRIWRIRAADARIRPRDASAGVSERLRHPDRRVREAAARELLETAADRRQLLAAVGDEDVRVRATALRALATVEDLRPTYFLRTADRERELSLRVLAVRAAVARGGAPLALRYARPDQPPCLRAEVLPALSLENSAQRRLVETALQDPDPLVFHAAVECVARQAHRRDIEGFPAAFHQGVLIALKRSDRRRELADPEFLKYFLRHGDPWVRFLAIKWVADDMVKGCRDYLVRIVHEGDPDQRVFVAAAVAVDRLDGRPPEDRPRADLLLQILKNRSADPLSLTHALRLIDPHDPRLRLDDLVALATRYAPWNVRREALLTLAEHPSEKRLDVLATLAADIAQPYGLRTVAVAGLAVDAQRRQDLFARLLDEIVNREQQIEDSDPEAGGSSVPPATAALYRFRDEVLRSLIGVRLSGGVAVRLQRLSVQYAGRTGVRARHVLEAIRRIREGSPGPRPESTDTEAWLKLAAGPGDPESGERVFFGRKVGLCYQCHEIDGRGARVGPPLSAIGRRLALQGEGGRRWLLETILQPGREMAPEYTPWQIVMKDGRVLIGLPRRKGGTAEAYLGKDGKEFTVKKAEMEYHRELRQSLMPEKLLDALTVQELRDLLAFLTARIAKN